MGNAVHSLRQLQWGGWTIKRVETPNTGQHLAGYNNVLNLILQLLEISGM